MKERYRGIYRIGLIVLVVISLMLCSLSRGMSQQGPRIDLQGTIALTPNIPTIHYDSPGTPVPFTIIDEEYPTAIVSGNFLTIENVSYPIGARFSDADQIPLGSINQDYLGGFGYAKILANGAEEYRLVWIFDGKFDTYYMIVKFDHPSFDGPDGFIEQLENLQKWEGKVEDRIMVELGAVAVVIGYDLGLCPVSLGTTCLKAAIVAAAGGLGAGAIAIWYIVHDIIPAIKNVQAAFVDLELHSP